MIELPELLKVQKGHHLLSAFIILYTGSVGMAEGVQCKWNNDDSAKLKWIPSISDATYEEELRTEVCSRGLNCKTAAVLITDPPQEEHELEFEYILKGDYRTKLSLYTDEKSELWSKVADFANPKVSWTTVSVKIPKNTEKLYLSGYVASKSNKMFLKGIGIPGVSKSCTDTPPSKIITTTTTTEKPELEEQGEIENSENEDEEKLQLQKVEVVTDFNFTVAALASGFTRVVTPILCIEE